VAGKARRLSDVGDRGGEIGRGGEDAVKAALRREPCGERSEPRAILQVDRLEQVGERAGWGVLVAVYGDDLPAAVMRGVDGDGLHRARAEYQHSFLHSTSFIVPRLMAYTSKVSPRENRRLSAALSGRKTRDRE